MMMGRFTLKPRGSFSLFASSTQPPLRVGDDAEDLLTLKPAHDQKTAFSDARRQLWSTHSVWVLMERLSRQ
jgi:hypothetical protein